MIDALRKQVRTDIKEGNYRQPKYQLVISTTLKTPKVVTTRKGQDYDIATDEGELCLDAPVLQETMLREYPEDKLSEGMNSEMTSLKDFETYEELQRISLTRGTTTKDDEDPMGTTVERQRRQS